MEELFAPYAKEVCIVDSIPGIDKISAMTVSTGICTVICTMPVDVFFWGCPIFNETAPGWEIMRLLY